MMEPVHEEHVIEVEPVEVVEIYGNNTPPETPNYGAHFPDIVKRKAYKFDGLGDFEEKEWDLEEGTGNEFCWYHIQLPRRDEGASYTLRINAQYLIDNLCPPLKLKDILSLASNGPFCGHVDGALVFRVNLPGPSYSDFTFRMAARVTQNSVITVSLDDVPSLDYSAEDGIRDALSMVPGLKSPFYITTKHRLGGMIFKHDLDNLLDRYHYEEADNTVPTSVSSLMTYVVDAHVDRIRDMATKIEMDLDWVETELNKDNFAFNKRMLDDKVFPAMRLNLQRLLQVIALGEQVFPKVKERCSLKHWFVGKDVNALDEINDRLRRLKENVEFVANRLTAIQDRLASFQAGLDRIQSEQINRRLYYLSIISIIFLPLSTIIGVFGMSVGGIPWIGQSNGFRNVILLCVTMPPLLLLTYFALPVIYIRVAAWWRKKMDIDEGPFFVEDNL